jgi:Holliday junction resolvase-like predicted endonuclease
LEELKSTSAAGYEAELLVIEDLKLKNCKIWGHRVQTPFAEVDIFFKSARGQLVLLEVKKLSRWDWLENRLGKRQIIRLKKARLYFESQYVESVLICVAFVIEKKIIYLNIE